MHWNRKSARKSLSFLLLALVVTAGCGSDDGAPSASIDAPGQGTNSSTQNESSSEVTQPVKIRAGVASDTPAPVILEDTRQFPEVVIKTTFGNIHVRLNAEKAPMTVDNFLLNYVDQGFYDNTIFHYVDKDFMIIAGGYTADLQQKTPRDGISNEANNGLQNLRGTIAMARDRTNADSANCQFFINLADNAALDHKSAAHADDYGYCVFGEVTQGMDVVDKIAEVAVADRDQFPKVPSEEVGLRSIKRLR